MTKSSFIRKYSNRFLSRWLVLVFDSLIVLFSFSIATLLRMNFQLLEIDFSIFASQLIFVLGLRLLAFLYFQSYAGIIRHTSIEDAILILKAVFAGSFGAVLVSAVIRNTMGFEHVFNLSASILIIDFFICLFWMVILRFFVKSFYESFINQFKPTIGVLIYGAGYTGMLTKNVFQTDRSTNYKILGFIDDNESKIGKTIEGIKVYSLPEVLDKFVGSNEGLEVIMAINNMSAKSKRKISDIFLDRGVVVKALPPVDKWVEGEFAMNQIHNVKIEDLLGREVIQMNNKRIGEEISGKVILVTGAAGSIGSEIVRQLIAYFPSKLVLVDQAESALYDLEYELAGKVPTNVQLIVNVADVSDTRRVSKIFNNHQPDIIFHAAAYKHVPLMENNPYEAIKTNVIGTRILAELASELGVEKFVMVSTDKAVNPTNVMGATKRLAEMYTQSMNQLEGVKTKFIATRFGNVLGSNGSVTVSYTHLTLPTKRIV